MDSIDKVLHPEEGWGRVWVVRDPSDQGNPPPIVAICATEALAVACAESYVKAYPGSEPTVEDYTLDRP